MGEKILLTSGCSFTDSNQGEWSYSWPDYLGNQLDCKVINLGYSARGNGYISRSIIYKTQELLKTVSAGDLLVGVMWSGLGRVDRYHTIPPTADYLSTNKIVNPYALSCSFPKKWVTMLPIGINGKSLMEKLYYKYFYDSFHATIETLEHILRVQWFLENRGITYFMAFYKDDVFFEKNSILENPDTNYLYDMINWEVMIEDEYYEWCENKSDLPMHWSLHPTPEQHSKFVKTVILPFLIDKKLINDIL